MRFEFKLSFDKSVKSFYGEEKEEIKQVALQAIDILSRGELLDVLSNLFLINNFRN